MKRLMWGAVCAVSALVLSILFAYGLLFVGNQEEREVAVVPSYVGRHEDGIGAVSGIALEYEYVYSEEGKAGEIIAQLPYPGARRKIKKGEACRVVLTVSLGKKKNSLPVLQGKAWNDAKAVLQSMGAKVEIECLDRLDMDSGVVLSAEPEAGTLIEEGQLVKIYVSRRPMHGSVQVGDYVGQYCDHVFTQILADGLLPGELLEIYSPLPKGTVLEQSLSPDRYVAYQTRIDLTVSRGETDGDLSPFPGGIAE